MIVAALLLQLTAGHAATTPVVAPRRPQPTDYRGYPSRTSRVRGWTVNQRICERRTNRACMTSPPDLVLAEADKPRDRQ